MERHFNGTQISLAGKTFSQAEMMAGQYFRLSPSEWKGHRYDVKTLAFLEKHEVREGAFAHLCRYQFRKEHEGAEEGCYFYRICLQDHNILKVINRNDGIELFPLMVYILTHELVHIIRFRKFMQRFDVDQEEKEIEEGKVHQTTYQILRSLKGINLNPIFDSYVGHRCPTNGIYGVQEVF